LNSLHDYLKVNYGNIASVAGLVLTAITLFNVRKIRNYYNFMGRSDTFVERLRRHSERLTYYLEDFAASKASVPVELKLTGATLESLEQILPGSQKQPVKRLLRKIRKYNATSSERYELRDIHDDILVVVQKVVDAQENLKWQLP
jgi:hypothetical protein